MSKGVESRLFTFVASKKDVIRKRETISKTLKIAFGYFVKTGFFLRLLMAKYCYSFLPSLNEGRVEGRGTFLCAFCIKNHIFADISA